MVVAMLRHYPNTLLSSSTLALQRLIDESRSSKDELAVSSLESDSHGWTQKGIWRHVQRHYRALRIMCLKGMTLAMVRWPLAKE